MQKWTHLIYDYCRDEGIPGAEEERAVDEDLLEEPVDEEQQEREKKHCWEIIRGFTLDTRPDLPEGPKQYQHFFSVNCWIGSQSGVHRGVGKKNGFVKM